MKLKESSETIAKDKEDLLKIRARLIIGRDGDENHQHALRTHNSHHNRIEILTFDQLLSIGKRPLNVFMSAQEKETKIPKNFKFDVSSPSDDDIPF